MKKQHDTTKYFLLENDNSMQNVPIIKNTSTSKGYSQCIIDKNYSMLPNLMVLPALEICDTSFQDVVLYPFFIIKNTMFNIMKSHFSDVKSKQIVIMNNFNNEMYSLPLIPRINCLTERSKISSNKKYLLYTELDYHKIEKHNVFYVGELMLDYIIIREDLAEELVEAGITGIHFSEVDIRL